MSNFKQGLIIKSVLSFSDKLAGVLPSQEEKQINTEYAVSLLEQLKLFYEQQLFTDIVLIVEGTEFPCHKMVLATCSSYFR